MKRSKPITKVVKTRSWELHPLDPWYSRAQGFAVGVAVTILVQMIAALWPG